MSFIDGEVQENEARLFGMLGDAFQIPEDEASQILVDVRDDLFKPREFEGTQKWGLPPEGD